jgi:hypothetical protein
MSERAPKVGCGQTVYCRGPGELNHVEETDAEVGTKSDTNVEAEREDDMETVQSTPLLDAYAPDSDEEEREEEKFYQWNKEIDSTITGSEPLAHSDAEMSESPDRAEKMNTVR